MRSIRPRALLAVLLFVGVCGCDRDTDAESDPVARLVRQLGDDRFARREAAARDLEVLGEKALPALRPAAVDNKDPEVRQRATRIIRAILAPARKSKSLGLEMVVVDAGEFSMGSQPGEGDRRIDETPHRVRITRSFLLGAYEVTQDEFRQVMKFNPSWFAPTGGGKDRVVGQRAGRFPVDSVTWFDAVEFCNQLSKRDGYQPFYRVTDVKRKGDSIESANVVAAGGAGYRLPTEAEWEYACRAGLKFRYHFGDGFSGPEANLKPLPATGYGGGFQRPSLGRTAQVGSYRPSSWGLHDMHGNVAEWCADWYGKDYYANSPVDDPAGPDKGLHRVLRGGSWLVLEGSGRCASRHWLTPGEGTYYTGFRVARTP